MMEGPLDLFGAKAFFGIVGDRQASGLSSTARDELGVFRDGSKGHVGALRALRADQKFNTDTSPGPSSLALLLPLPFSLSLSSHIEISHHNFFVACIRL